MKVIVSIPNSKRLRTPKVTKAGFALILSLLVMSSIVLVTLALSSLLKTQMGTVQSSKNYHEAQQFALLGLKKAVAQLQIHTGKDQVTTAPADLFNRTPSGSNQQNHWIGVWDTKEIWSQDKKYFKSQKAWDHKSSKAKKNLVKTWLVSGSHLDPEQEIAAGDSNFSKLALSSNHNNSLEVGVYAQKEWIKNLDNKEIGNFAWWISDENTKARINLKNPYLESATSAKSYYNSTIAQRTGVEFPLNLNTQYIQDFSKLYSTPSLSLLNKKLDSPSQYIHDFTANGAGLLTDQRQGGLKQDLSIAFDIPDEYLHKSTHYSGRNDVFNESALPTEMFQNISSTNPISMDSPNRRKNYIFTLEDISFKEVPNFDVQGMDSTSTIDSARWSVLAYHHNLYRYLSNTHNADPVLNNQRAWQASSSLIEPAGVIGGMNFSVGDRFFRPATGGDKNVAHLSKYKGQIHRNQTAVWSNQNGDVLNQGHFWEAEELTTYPIHPLVTEIMLIVELSYTSDGLIKLDYYPMIELTNPYDVRINPQNDLQINLVGQFSSAPNLIDFKLSGSGVTDNIWSNKRTFQSGASNPYFTGGDYSSSYKFWEIGKNRCVESLIYSNCLNIPNSPDYTTPWDADYSYFVKQNNIGILDPGQSKTYVLNPASNFNVLFELIEGSDPFQGSFEKVVKTFQSYGSQGAMQFGDSSHPNYPANFWPEDPTRFDELETELSITPKLNDTKNVIIEVLQGDSSEIIRMSPAAATEKAVFTPKYNTLTKGSNITLYTLHFERRSLNNFKQLSDETKNNAFTNSFLGSFNPRALLSDYEHGIYDTNHSDQINFGTPNWQISYGTAGSYPNFAGMGTWGDDSSNGSSPVYFHIPRRPPISIGEYRHANLGSFAYEPAYVIGSSVNPLQDMRTGADRSMPYQVWHSGWGQKTSLSTVQNFAFGTKKSKFQSELIRSNLFLDLSYLYNSELWDSFYLSTLNRDNVQDALNGVSLPNSRIKLHSFSQDPNPEDTIADYQSNASLFTIQGAFNVNSTSKDAWLAQLMSMRNVSSLNSLVKSDHVYLRHPSIQPTSNSNKEWSGYNAFNQSQLESLSEKIVEEVKDRGPFISLSHFVNRQLTNDSKGLSGAIHAAIEKSNLNSDLHPNALGSLTQGDIMTALGPNLIARGDTFMIRTKGESIDPVSEKVKSSAYCQAIVQRVPDYMDSKIDSSSTHPKDLKSSENLRFGRKYQILSIQWLNEKQL